MGILQARVFVQGRLILDKPYPLAAPQSGMPFCKEFQECSCCNSSHVVTIRNDILHLSLDESMSQQCLLDVEAHSCSVCDPWVCNASFTSPCCTTATGCSCIGVGPRFHDILYIVRICNEIPPSRNRSSILNTVPCHHVHTELLTASHVLAASNMPHSLVGRCWWTQIVSAKLL